jgi:hypothetical protein
MSTVWTPFEDTREALAEYAHEAWSGWMKYMFEKMHAVSHDGENTSMVMPAWAVERWTRQANTPYADLPENEKESDRQEADRMLAICRRTSSPAAAREGSSMGIDRKDSAMAMITELLPCMRPGCKGKPELDKWDAGDYGIGWEYCVSCDTCGLSTLRYEKGEDAVGDWNQRSVPDAAPVLSVAMTPERIAALHHVLRYAEIGIGHDEYDPNLQVIKAWLDSIGGDNAA